MTTYTTTPQDDSNLDVTVKDGETVTITIQPVTVSGGVASVNGETGAPSGDVVLDTDDIDEGSSNLYYTDARFDTRLATKTTTDLTEGDNLYYTDERVDDRVNSLLQAGNGIALDYNDTDGELTITSDFMEETVKNATSATLNKGTPVYVTGIDGNKPTVDAADAGDPTKKPAIGILNENIAPDTEGKMLISGRISGVDTSGFSEGDTIYLADGGGYTNVRPSSESVAVQNLGFVTKVHATNGGGIVYGSGRSNDVPNLTSGHVFIGNSSGYETRALTEADISDLQSYLTAETNDLTSAVTWANVPDANITESSVTQHQGALSITESQISDLSHFSGSYDDLTDTPDLTSIDLPGNTFFEVNGNYNFGLDGSATGKYRPTNWSAHPSLDYFMMHQWHTENDHNVASLGSRGSADDGSHNALWLIHGADNVFKSVANGSLTTTAPLEINSTTLNLNASDTVSIQNDTELNGQLTVTHLDNSLPNIARFRREVDTLSNDQESGIEIGMYNSDTFYKGGRIATQYRDDNQYEFKLQVYDPNDDTTFNNLTIREDYIYSDNPFEMTNLNDTEASGWSNHRGGLLIWNTVVSHLQVSDGTNWKDVAFLEETKDINLDSNSFLTINSDYNTGPFDLSATGKYVPVNLDVLGGVYSAVDGMWLANSFGTPNGKNIARLVAIGGDETTPGTFDDNGTHDGALMLHGSNNKIISWTEGSFSERPLEIVAQNVKTPQLIAVEDKAHDGDDAQPLRIVRNNTSGGSTINDDTKVAVSFQIADGDNEWNSGNVTAVGGLTAVYDSTNGNAFRLYVDHNDGSDSHEMEVNEGFFKVSRPMRFSQYITTTAPDATNQAGEVIYVSDGDAGSPCLAMSDGTNWKVLATLGATISNT